MALTSSVSAVANENTFKLAIIKDYLGSREIVDGDFTKSIAYLTRKNADKSSFELNMGLCTSYIKTHDINHSESACTAAITDLQSIKTNNKQVTYLQSVSYSNRGVARYLKNDFTGALEDLTTAISIDSNSITENNLTLAKRKLSADTRDNMAGISD